MSKKLDSLNFGFFQFFNKITCSMLGYKIVTFIAKRYPILHIVRVAAHRFGIDMMNMHSFMNIAPSTLVSEPAKKFVYSRHGRPILTSIEKSKGVIVKAMKPLSRLIQNNTPRDGTKGCHRNLPLKPNLQMYGMNKMVNIITIIIFIFMVVFVLLLFYYYTIIN